jgi:hypothetical protein
MSEPKDSNSFFRKVVKFVANPATDWNELNAPQNEVRDQEFAKSELKAMIERKRRNDFVRKREFDMLRKVRREGLSAEQLAALGGSSKLDDSESRAPDNSIRQGGGVKAKIDAIEQQMVGDGIAAPARRPPASPRGDSFSVSTKPSPIGSPAAMPLPAASVPPLAPRSGARMGSARTAPLLTEVVPDDALVGSRAQAIDADLALEDLEAGRSGLKPPEGNELPHDPDLDEAVIAFANADFEACEQSLMALVASNGPRAQHAETWLVLFDLYRAVGQQAKFEALAIDYGQQFGWAPPRWFSMPQLVADAAAEQRAQSPAAPELQVGWVAPPYFNRE